MREGIHINYWRNNLDRELTGLVNGIPLMFSLILSWGILQIYDRGILIVTGLILFVIIFFGIITRIYTNAKLLITAEGFLIKRGRSIVSIKWSEIKSISFEKEKVGADVVFPAIIMKIECEEDELDLRIEKNLWITPMMKYKATIELINFFAPNIREQIRSSV